MLHVERMKERKNNGTAGQTFTTDEIVKRRRKKKLANTQ